MIPYGRGTPPLMKTDSESDAARENAARKRRGARRVEPIVVDWDRALSGVKRIFAELYPDENPDLSTGTVS